MIATLSVVVFIFTEKQEIVQNKMLQKGQAISKLSGDSKQIYRYSLFTPLPQTEHATENADADDNPVHLVEAGSVYFIHGKFSMNANGTLEVTITSNRFLDIPDNSGAFRHVFADYCQNSAKVLRAEP